MAKTDAFFQQLGLGVAGITFGAALSIFIYATASGTVAGTAAWLLLITSFLLMLRFWWRYTTVFVQHAPSRTFFQFLCDFAIGFFGISSVLFVKDIRAWALLVGGAMLASIIRCWLARPAGAASKAVQRTLWGAVVMLVMMAAVYFAAQTIAHTMLATIVLALVALFVLYAAKKP
jgi:hypothetical protein